MDSRTFAVGLLRSVVEEGSRAYEDMFTGSRPDQSTDPYGRRALSLFHSLTPEQKQDFFEVLRQVSVDTVSSVLAILDGVSFINGYTERYILVYGDGQNLSGDLQSLFLVEEEDRGGRGTRTEL
jgi:hypothetical protein